jgi:dTDP-4-dehydrorhamnose 3,5-epimerase
MKYIKTKIPEVIIIEPDLFGDERGYFMISYSQKEFEENVLKTQFIQDNESMSGYGVLRGLHYQLPPYAQAKLVRVVLGKVLDVAVDIRKNSPTFGQYVAVELSEENKRQLFIPRGFAHGFAVLSEKAIFQYKIDNVYAPKHERGIAFNDNSLNIDWKISPENIILSQKDKQNPLLGDADLF